MLRRLSSVLEILIKPRILYSLISLNYRSYFKDIGWLNSLHSNKPVGKNNEPLPWVTYPFIHFIQGRINKGMDIFEFGSGNSTHFYAFYAKSVTTVEHDKKWYEAVKKSMPENVYLIYQHLEHGEDYCKMAAQITAQTKKKYDIIIIDGRDRVHCIKKSLDTLKDDGVIVLDDSEVTRYSYGIDFLSEKGFKRIDFWGFSPGYFYKKCTTVFYRSNNCLEI